MFKTPNTLICIRERIIHQSIDIEFLHKPIPLQHLDRTPCPTNTILLRYIPLPRERNCLQTSLDICIFSPLWHFPNHDHPEEVADERWVELVLCAEVPVVFWVEIQVGDGVHADAVGHIVGVAVPSGGGFGGYEDAPVVGGVSKALSVFAE